MHSTIERYGDLSESELTEFLQVIESDDDDIIEAEEKAGKNIVDEEGCLPDEMLDDGAWVVSKQWEKVGEDKYRFVGLHYHLKSTNDAYKKEIAQLRRETGTKHYVERAAEIAKQKKQRKIEISRAACNQNELFISDCMTKEQLKALIAELTKEHAQMVEKLFTFINRRFGMLLGPLIPRTLRNCAEQYPQSVIKCKGFMYRASEKYGKGLCFWATPDIPYYFTQGTEQAILEKLKPEFLFRIDKSIVQYNYHKNMQAEKEVKYAAALVDKNIKTFYDLLKYNPFWFEKMFKIATGKDLKLECSDVYNN